MRKREACFKEVCLFVLLAIKIDKLDFAYIRYVKKYLGVFVYYIYVNMSLLFMNYSHSRCGENMLAQ